MKKRFKQFVSLLLSVLMVTSIYTALPAVVNAEDTAGSGGAKPYATYTSSNNTLTFKYDSNYSEDDYDIPDSSYPKWKNQVIETVEFKSTFRSARPTSTIGWFKGLKNLTEIRNIGYLNTSEVTSMNEMFYNCQNLTSLDLSGFNFSKVTDMSSMFFNCKALTTIDLGSSTTPSVTSMRSMFYGCESLKSLNLVHFTTRKVIDMSSMFSGCKSLTELGLYGFNTPNVTNMSSMFYNCENLKNIYISKTPGEFNTSKVTDMSDMFHGCQALESFDFDYFDTSNVTDMSDMFYNCGSITALNLKSFDTSSVTNMQRMFSYCGNLKTIEVGGKWSTDNVTDAYSSEMFRSCTSLKGGNGTTFDTNHIDKEYARVDNASHKGYLTGSTAYARRSGDTLTFYFDNNYKSDSDFEITNESEQPAWTWGANSSDSITKVLFDESFKEARPRNTSYWFYWLNNLKEIENLDYLDTSQVTDMSNMFNGCNKLTSIDISGFNTSKVTKMSAMFIGCKSLTSLDVSNFDTSNVTEMGSMFSGCNSLTSLDLSAFDTSKVTVMSNMFIYCNKLTSLDLRSFDTSNVTDMDEMFNRCFNLETIKVSSKWNTDNVTSSLDMFYGCDSLKGGNGTAYYYRNVGKQFARIDTASDKGYLTGYAINIEDAENGTVTADAKSTAEGETVKLTITPDSGCEFDSLTVKDSSGNEITVTDNSFIMPASDVTVSAEFIGAKAYAYRLGDTLTFYYDTNYGKWDGEYYEIPEVVSYPGWFTKYMYIAKVVFDESFKDARPKITFNWFTSFSHLTEIENINYLNTSEVTNMGYMFYGCEKLTSLDLSSFDTSNVTDMACMFYDCTNLKTIKAGSKWNTDKVTSSNNMFTNCESLEGGNGTDFDSSHIDKEYARIDTAADKGYLTGYAINIEEAENGAVSADAKSTAEGETVKLTAAPDKSYALDSVTVKDSSGNEVTVTDNSFTMPASDVTVSAVFKKASYKITYNASEHGSVSGLETANYGDTVTLTVSPDSNYELDSLEVTDSSNNNVEVNDDYTFAMPDGNVTVKASFIQSTVNIYVGGVQIKRDNCANIPHNGTGKVSYNFDTNTLTLDNASVEATVRADGGTPEGAFGIRYNEPSADKEFTIELIGENVITNNEYDEGVQETYGILLYASALSFRITGGGKLDLAIPSSQESVTYYGIQSRKSLTIDGSDVSVEMSGSDSPATGLDLIYSDSVLKLVNNASLKISTGINENSVSLASNNNIENLSVESGCAFEAISQNQAVNGNINLTSATKALGARVNTENTKKNSTKWDGTTSLASYKYIRVPDDIVYYNVVVNDSSNGIVSADSDSAEEGESVTLTALPEKGYELDSFTVKDSSGNEVTVTDNSFTMPASDVTVSAGFKKATYKITYTNYANGSLSGPETAHYGDSITINVTPASGYSNTSILVSTDIGSIAVSTEETFTMPAGDVTVYAVFKLIKPYAEYSTNGKKTLTFKYGADYGYSAYDIPDSGTPKWSREYGSEIQSVVFDDSFAKVKPKSTYRWFSDLTALTEITDIKNLNTSEVTNMSEMFYRCHALTSLDLTGFDFSNVTTMEKMFADCRALASLALYNTQTPHTTPNVTDMSYMFRNCYALEQLNLYSFITRNVTDMSYMFSGCKALTELGLSGFNTSKVTNMSSMFNACENLKNIYISPTDFTTSNVTNMSNMFSNCKALTNFDFSYFDTSSVENMSGMFSECAALTSLDLSSFDTSNVTDMTSMFSGCGNLTTITAGSKWSTDKVEKSGSMFSGCTSIKGGKGTKYDSNIIDKSYARIDTTNDKGYLTGLYYTVTWLDDNGDNLGEDKLYYGETPSHADMTKDIDDAYDYTFVGWTPEIKPVTEDITYTAVYTRTLKRFRYDKSTKTLTLVWGDFDASEEWTGVFYQADVKYVEAEKGVRFVGDCRDLFMGFGKCESIDLSNVDTSLATNMSELFDSCVNLKTLNINGFDTSNVTDMSSMFYACEKLEELDVSGFDTSKVTNMSHMFHRCSALKSLDVMNFNTSAVTDMRAMFINCATLKSLNLTSFDTSSVTDMSGMFHSCGKLEAITVSDSWTTQNVTESGDMFTSCESLKGGKGTVYDDNYTDKTYAHTDGGETNPGYLTPSTKEYIVIWNNYDGSELERDTNVKEGTYPSYDGSEPVREDEAHKYVYTFSGWTPRLINVGGSNDIITYTATFTKSVYVDYIDENGDTKTVNATVLSSDTTANSETGWYAVTEDVSFDTYLGLENDAKLILCDGAALTLKDYAAINAESLKIYGQEDGSGTLSCSGEALLFTISAGSVELYGGRLESVGKNDILVSTGNISVNGGVVKDLALVAVGDLTVNGGKIDIDTDYDYALVSLHNLCVKGGNVSAAGAKYGFYTDGGDVSLSWTNETDSVYANSYEGSVTLEKSFTDSDDNAYEAGLVSDNEAINDKTLYAVHTHSYGEPEWTWADDNSSAEAKFTCSICGHTETVSAESSCELLGHKCDEAGENKYTVTITFEGKEYSVDKTETVEATEHTYGDAKTILKVHCMRDGLNRYTCLMCGETKDETVKCPGKHNFTTRTISYEEYKEEIENEETENNNKNAALNAGTHTALNLLSSSNSNNNNTYTLKECTNDGCGVKVVETPSGDMYVRYSEDEWSEDASTCANSNADSTSLANGLAGEVASLTVGAAGKTGGILLTKNLAIGAGAVLGAVVTIFAVFKSKNKDVKVSEDDEFSGGDIKECSHEKTVVTTKQATCTEKGETQTICWKCGTVFDTKSIEPLGHDWGEGWVFTSRNVKELEEEWTRTCTRCKKQEKEKRKLAEATLKLEYTDDGVNYKSDTLDANGKGVTTGCYVKFTDFSSYISGSATYALDYEDSGARFNFTALNKNGYEFAGWYHSGVPYSSIAESSAPKVGSEEYTARFKKRSLSLSHKLYDGEDKSGGDAECKISAKVKKGDEVVKEYKGTKENIAIDSQYLTSDYSVEVHLITDPKDKCAFIKDMRTYYKDGEVVGDKNKKISGDEEDKDKHVMKKVDHKYTFKISELIENGKLTVDKIEYSTDVEKGIKIKVNKIDTDKYPNSTAKIDDKDATGGLTVIKQKGDKYTIEASAPDGINFDAWRAGKKIITCKEKYEGTAYADIEYTAVLHNTILINYVDFFGNFIAEQPQGDKPPEPYVYEGYKFLKWDKEPTEITKSGECVTAIYERNHAKVKITADGCTITGQVDGKDNIVTKENELSVDYDTSVTVKKSGAKLWKIDGKIVGYGESYTFYSDEDVTITYEASSSSEEPKVTILNAKLASEDSYKISFVANRTVPEGYTFIQAGFVYGMNMKDSDLTLDKLGEQGTLEYNGEIISGTVKATYCAGTDANGQFTLEYGIKGKNAAAMAKAFVSYKDKDGKVQIIYSDMETFIY